MNGSLVTVLLLSLAVASLARQDRGRGAPSGGGAPGSGAQGGRGDGKPQDRDASKKKSNKDEDLAAVYFKICDYDGDGSISFSEAQLSLSLDKATFRDAYDADHDGLISPEEFKKRYVAIVAAGGAFAPPAGKLDAKKKPPTRTAAELLEAYDDDRDKALSETEITKALHEYGAHGVDAKVILMQLDHDASKKLEIDEMPDFLDILAPSGPNTKTKVASIAALFDRVEQRTSKHDSTPQPARIVGPVTAFRRLDFDNSGGIDVGDLTLLQHPLQLPVRMNAVLATMDTDGDGVISAAEFWAAMSKLGASMRALAIVLLCVVAAIAYGIAHDLVTAHVCVEYFTIGHPHLVPGDDPVVQALGWGVIATWWVGLILGLALALAARAGARPPRDARSLVKPVAIVMLISAACALAAGLIGHAFAQQGMVVLPEPFASRVPAEKHVAFLTDAWAHSASYLASFVGGLVLVVVTWRSRASSTRMTTPLR